jgi:hypothetical protein
VQKNSPRKRDSSSVEPLLSTSSLLPITSSPSLSSASLSVTIVSIVDVVIRRAVAIIVDVRRTVTIVDDAVARRAVAIIVDNGKMPVHWQRQRRHRDEGNNAIATTAKTPGASAAMTPSQQG